MTIVSEVKQSLNVLKDVRKFFIEKDYETEMQNLERFINLCKEIKQLKEDGIFDAVCDATPGRSALRYGKPAAATDANSVNDCSVVFFFLVLDGNRFGHFIDRIFLARVRE